MAMTDSFLHIINFLLQQEAISVFDTEETLITVGL